MIDMNTGRKRSQPPLHGQMSRQEYLSAKGGSSPPSEEVHTDPLEAPAAPQEIVSGQQIGGQHGLQSSNREPHENLHETLRWMRTWRISSSSSRSYPCCIRQCGFAAHLPDRQQLLRAAAEPSYLIPRLGCKTWSTQSAKGLPTNLGLMR